MEQRFIICTNSAVGIPNGATAEERNEITRYLESQKWQVWHWFEDIWLVVIPGNSMSSGALTRALRKLLVKTRFVLVMKVEGPIEYTGFGNATGWPWMEKNWGDPI